MPAHKNSSIRRAREPRAADQHEGVALERVASSALHSIGYDAAKKTLHIRFASGGATYEYPDISQAQYDALMAAESKGSHFRQHILGSDFRRHAG
jgi:hypothetical protein